MFDLIFLELLKVKRVQKYIETLDVLKMMNSKLEQQHQQHQILPKTFRKKQDLKENGNFNYGQVVVTTKWETF